MEDNVRLEDLIKHHQISMTMKRVRSNPILSDRDGEGVDHYKCRLTRPGKMMDFYFSISAEEGLLTLQDVLFLLAMDACSCRMLEGYEAYRDELASMFVGQDGNLREIEDFWREYRGRCTQAEELRSFLGETTYRQLLRQFSPNIGFL